MIVDAQSLRVFVSALSVKESLLEKSLPKTLLENLQCGILDLSFIDMQVGIFIGINLPPPSLAI